MPLVKRLIKQVIGPTFGEKAAEHILFVPARAMRIGDVVVEPTPKQLADLAYRFPDEPSGKPGSATFAELAAERDIQPLEPAPFVDDLREDSEETAVLANLALQMFPAMKQADAIAFIDKVPDVALLQQLLQAELDSAAPRPSVLEAFAAHGLTVPKAGEGDADDDADLEGEIDDE